MLRASQGGGSRDDWLVRVPASSANLGSAFDAVALALDTYLEVTADASDPAPETHPAVRAFRQGGGVGPIATAKDQKAWSKTEEELAKLKSLTLEDVTPEKEAKPADDPGTSSHPQE